MKFRTEIGLLKGGFQISHDDRIVMLGSCFADNVGQELEKDGFNVTYNPMGPLYNILSIEKAICSDNIGAQLLEDAQELWHCLDFHTQYTLPSKEELKDIVLQDITSLRQKLQEASVIIITLGTSWAYFFDNNIVGNCHKFPAHLFERKFIDKSQATRAIRNILEVLGKDKKYIFTVSPIRHTADSLHGNQLSKANLLLSVDEVINNSPFTFDYFPAYEIMMDDLRDYRFYAADMKHPNDVAVEYIYEKFKETYFSTTTIEHAKEARSQWKRANHRKIL